MSADMRCRLFEFVGGGGRGRSPSGDCEIKRSTETIRKVLSGPDFE